MYHKPARRVIDVDSRREYALVPAHDDLYRLIPVSDDDVCGIGLAGRYGHGKTTVAQKMCRANPNLVSLSFGTALKTVCCALMDGCVFQTQADKNIPIYPGTKFDVDAAVDTYLDLIPDARQHRLLRWKDRETICDIFKEHLAAHPSPTRGALLQTVGTDIFREKVHPDAWVWPLESVIQRLNRSRSPWIVDDVRFFNELRLVEESGVMMRVEAPTLTDGARDHNHPSESAMDEIWMHTFVNDRSAEQNERLNGLCLGTVEAVAEAIQTLPFRQSRFYKPKE